MPSPRLKTPSLFVVTLLWIGFVFSIGFIETPVRFMPDEVSLIEALSIGKLLFHILNPIELVFAVGSAIVVFGFYSHRFSRSTKIFLTLVLVLLAIQTLLLYTVLDARTDARLRGEDVPPASYHLIYISLDLMKIGCLGVLSFFQIGDYAEGIRNGSDQKP